MDVQARQGLWQAIEDLKARGTGIVLTTHYLEEADKLADQIVLLKQGQIIKRGSSDELKASVNLTTIRFSSPAFPNNFADLPAVIKVKTHGTFTLVHSDNSNLTLTALLATHPDIANLSVTNTGLEEAFLHLNKLGEK
jgi:ABC-2 type transport system ATP-binding protein